MRNIFLFLFFVCLNANAYIPTGGYIGYGEPVSSGAMLPVIGNTDGDVRIALDTKGLYSYDSLTTNWLLIASPAAATAVTALIGDVHCTGPGACVSTIQPNVVSNSKLAQAPTLTMKGNVTGVTANEQDLTVSQVFTLLGLGTAATQNSTAFDSSGAAATAQAFAIQRANHTGTQTASTISDFSSSVQTTAKNGTSGQEFFVAQDVGSNSNDGSILHPFAAIQNGINACEAVAAYLKQCIVHVAPPSGTNSYLENLTMSQQGVTLQCDNPVSNTRSCTVNGTLTVNLTGTSGGANFIAASNQVYVNGMIFTGGASSALTFSGTTFQRLIAVNDYFQSSSASALVASNSGVNVVPSTISSYDTVFENNSSTVATITLSSTSRDWHFGTQPTIQNDNSSGPSLSQSGASSFVCNLCTINGQAKITDNTSSATFNLATITSGSASCIDTPSSPSTGLITWAYAGCTSTNTNTFTGSGFMALLGGNVRLSTSGDVVNTITQAVVPGLPQGEMMLGAGSTTGTNVLLSIKGGHIKVAQTTAPTTTLSGNAGTGGSPACTVSNATDTAGTINLTTGTASWASGTQCTINFNKAYGVAPICVISEANAQTAASKVTQQVNAPDAATTNFTINFGAADTAQHTFKWKYHCIETQ